MSDLGALNAVAYGPEWSARWDEDDGVRPNTEDAVRCLAELAAGRPALEFGVGTGRLALPLQEQGLCVHGIDSSPWMVEQLRRKPGGQRLPVTLGDFATTKVKGVYGLVFVADNTLFALTTQELQVQCFRNAAAHLERGGAFVIEAIAPFDHVLTQCRTLKVETDQVVLLVTSIDAVTQQMQQSYLYVRDGQSPRVQPFASRYAWPAELDLMACVAGMRRRHRWGGWDKRPFTAKSSEHITVYERVLKTR
jgi:Methyltransferase domain